MKLLKLLMILGFLVAPLSSTSAAQSQSKREKMETSHSMAPFAGFTPTYGLFLGGGYFYDSPTFEIDVEGVVTFRDAYQLVVEPSLFFGETERAKFEVKANRGFDPYYGHGSQTLISDRLDILGDQFELSLSYEKEVFEHWTAAVLLLTRIRTEQKIKNRPGLELFPDETSAGLAVKLTYDKTDRETSPHSGFRVGLLLKYFPSFLLSVDSQEGFGQLEWEGSVYHSLSKEVVLAFHLEGGVSLGTPTYMYTYTFGGPDRMRGFHENRFRGNLYYLQQTELRFPLWRFFRGAVFMSMGDIDDSNLTTPLLSYGAGIRIGLPPDFIEKARIDIGFGSDQMGLFIDFGHAF